MNKMEAPLTGSKAEARGLGAPVWWSTGGTNRFSGTVLRHGPDGYLVTLHDHPAWRWVEHVPAAQLADRAETPELVVTTEDDSGLTVTTWTCPWPGHHDSTISSHSSDVGSARRGCARYMPPLGHDHSSPFPAELLPEDIDPAAVPVWTGGTAATEPMQDSGEPCRGCAVAPGQHHVEDCIHAVCPDCGEQLYMHECEYWAEDADGPDRPALWHGIDPRTEVARARNWWTTVYGIDHLVEDYTRVLFAIGLDQVVWDGQDQRYVIGEIDEARLDLAIATSR
jgi:hypothetical protein